MNRRHFCSSALAAAVAASLPGRTSYGSVLQSLTQVSSSIAAVSGGGDEIELEQAAIQELKDALRGELLLSGSEGYDKARRVLNPSIDKYPALVVRPTGVSDIANAVRFAHDRDLLLAVKCGGHSFSGKSSCDGGMQIDLSSIRHVRGDPESRTAYVSGGSLLGELDHETMSLGLVTTAGTVSHTGVGGLTLGGGFGRLARKYGLALDNVKAVDIVTADGELRHASAEENPDLYWGNLGGGGNFGVVTSFEFDLHPMNRIVIAGDAIFPVERARDVLRFYADYSQDAPDELSLDLVMVAPPGGEPGVALIHACYSGDPKNADRVLGPLNGFGEPIANNIGPMDYVALQRVWDDSDPRHGGDYLKGGFVTEINDGLVNAIADGFEGHPDRTTTFFFQQAGGAIGRVATDATAFAHRYATNGPAVIAAWNPDVDPQPHIQYVRDYWSDIERFTHGFYMNMIGDESTSTINKNYEQNFDRLRTIKNKYDPTNLFQVSEHRLGQGEIK
jgi:FAD/FMN-containing dehydrogenase